RFGHFQIHASLNELDELRQLVEYTLENFYPGKTIEEFFLDVVNKTAFLITEWYRVGFVHGVMNTDNLSIHGLTIDYGPYGWLDVFDPDWTPNTTDFSNRRYRFMNQHNIAFWNLARLAEALETLGPNLKSSLDRFPEIFKFHMGTMMENKLGLRTYNDQLVNKTFHLLTDLKGDMTLFYRYLMRRIEGKKPEFKECFYKELTPNDEEQLNGFLKTWESLLDKDPLEKMNKANPVFIPRNYIVQEALDSLEKGDDQILRRLEKAMLSPYKETTDTLHWFKKRPDWAATRPGCSTLSCSS
ncbi:MAG: protein adenylyltransferase SelO family protein, partial [Halobacteriovoraceae bacterium]|nr:protein adenylyltransferase SelO family protein [Halobacteriovoraceae bacterium]